MANLACVLFEWILLTITIVTANKKIKVVNALTSGGIGCLVNIFWMYVEIVSNPGSFKYCVITKSSSDNVYESIKIYTLLAKLIYTVWNEYLYIMTDINYHKQRYEKLIYQLNQIKM